MGNAHRTIHVGMNPAREHSFAFVTWTKSLFLVHVSSISAPLLQEARWEANLSRCARPELPAPASPCVLPARLVVI
jgi:hypothetical protein